MQSEWMKLATAKWVLGLLSSEELLEIATRALDDGFDTPALRRLAGELRPTMRDSGALFEQVLRELGITLPAKLDAGLTVAREYAGEISAGAISPHEGARRIWREIQLEVEEMGHVLDPFVYWASEWDDANNSARREYCEAAFREAARALLDAA